MPGNSFHLHRAGDEAHVLSLLAAQAEEATSTLGVYAWASSRGLQLMLETQQFANSLARGLHVSLVIGTDAVTDPATLTAARKYTARYPNIDIRFFVHDRPWIFHPKFALFERADGSGSLVLGSGNLTDWGLRNNWEATTVLKLDEAGSIRAQVEAWLDEHAEYIFEVDSAEVAGRVAQNLGSERAIKRAAEVQPPDSPSASEWLIAELNKSRRNLAGQSMFSQASFDRSTFESFFQYAGAAVELSLFGVSADGIVGELEARTARFKPRSINYYFELGQAAGIPYPVSARPIGLFCRTEDYTFMYRVLMPDDPEYAEVESLLRSRAGAPRTTMRRERFDPDEIELSLPDLSVMKAQIPMP